MKPHPLIRQFIANAKRKGVAIYAGKNFVVARWENGDSVELRVDIPNGGVKRDR
jgi:hypothetical protein